MYLSTVQPQDVHWTKGNLLKLWRKKRNLKNGWILTLCFGGVQWKIYKEFFFLVFWEGNPPCNNVHNLFRSAVGLSREVCLSQQGLWWQSCPLPDGTSHPLRLPSLSVLWTSEGPSPGPHPFHKVSVTLSGVFFQRCSVVFAKWREKLWGESWKMLWRNVIKKKKSISIIGTIVENDSLFSGMREEEVYLMA